MRLVSSQQQRHSQVMMTGWADRRGAAADPGEGVVVEGDDLPLGDELGDARPATMRIRVATMGWI